MDLPLVAVLLDGHIGNDDAVVVFGEAAAGGGVEFADFLDRGLYLVGIGRKLTREFRDAPAGEQLEVIPDHAQRQRIAAAIGGELQEEALGEIFGPNAGRIKGFEDLQCLLDGVESKARLQCDVGGRLGEETAVVETADQLSHRCQCRRREIRHFRLLHEMLLQ